MMKIKLSILLLTAWLSVCCYENNVIRAEEPSNSSVESAVMLYLTIGGVTKTATLASNSSTDALVKQLQQGDITYEAHDYGGFEKVGNLGYSFPVNDEEITTQPGDLILYQGNNLCIYYGTNSWYFTRIGRLVNMSQSDIKQWVNAGGDDVSVTLSLSMPMALKQRLTDNNETEPYTLSGTIAQSNTKGIIIKNGKKTIK